MLVTSHTNRGGYTEETGCEPPSSVNKGSYCSLALPREDDSDAEYPTTNNRSTRCDSPQPFVYLGYCCAILAGLCFTSSNVMVKYIPSVNSWQLLLVRCLAQLATMIPVMVMGKHNIFGTPDFATRWRIAAQGVLGGFLLLAIFEAVAIMPLGDCVAIFFSSPAFTMVLSCIILKDHCGAWRVLVALTLLTGVMILSRPPLLFPATPGPANHTLHRDHDHGMPGDGGYDVLGVVAALALPTLSAWIVIITRQAKHVHYSVLVFWFGVGGLVVSIIGIFVMNKDPMFHDWHIRQWMLSFMIALVGILGSIVMTKAVCWVMPSKVMVVRSFEVVAAYILQVTTGARRGNWGPASLVLRGGSVGRAGAITRIQPALATCRCVWSLWSSRVLGGSIS